MAILACPLSSAKAPALRTLGKLRRSRSSNRSPMFAKFCALKCFWRAYIEITTGIHGVKSEHRFGSPDPLQSSYCAIPSSKRGVGTSGISAGATIVPEGEQQHTDSTGKTRGISRMTAVSSESPAQMR